MKAIILAGGKGNRLKPITETTPKPLIEISGKKIVDRIFENLPEQIDEVVLVVNYLKEQIKEYVGDNFYNKKIFYVEQGVVKGTYGALLSAKNLIKDNERFLVINGDDINQKEYLEKHLKHERTFGVQRIKMPTEYHSIEIDSKNQLVGFRPQSEEEKINGAIIATGVYVLSANIFEHPGVLLKDGEYGLPQTILAQKNQYSAVCIESKNWLPINSIEDLEQARKSIKLELKIVM